MCVCVLTRGVIVYICIFFLLLNFVVSDLVWSTFGIYFFCSSVVCVRIETNFNIYYTRVLKSCIFFTFVLFSKRAHVGAAH